MGSHGGRGTDLGRGKREELRFRRAKLEMPIHKTSKWRPQEGI